MRGAILIIGSLLWDEERAAWRSSRLSSDERQLVRTPINYGRRSHSRGNTFTMTFIPNAPLGQGVLLPCKNPVLTFEDLLTEAQELWRAEAKTVARGCIGVLFREPKAKTESLGKAWGCVGVLFRDPASGYAQNWCEVFRKKASPVSPVDDRGILGIPWPETTERVAADADFILGTATRRECESPSVKDIVDAWLNQVGGHEHYFFKNVEAGIRTHQDGAIWRAMVDASPKWLAAPEYSKAVAILEEEAVCSSA
jgi:hypothetical protein